MCARTLKCRERHNRVEGRELDFRQVPASKQRHSERPEHVYRNVTQYCLQLLRQSHRHVCFRKTKQQRKTASHSTERPKKAPRTGHPAPAHPRTPPRPPGLQQRAKTLHRIVLFGNGTSTNREGAHAPHATDEGWSKGELPIQLSMAGCPGRKASHQEAHCPSPTWCGAEPATTVRASPCSLPSALTLRQRMPEPKPQPSLCKNTSVHVTPTMGASVRQVPNKLARRMELSKEEATDTARKLMRKYEVVHLKAATFDRGAGGRKLSTIADTSLTTRAPSSGVLHLCGHRARVQPTPLVQASNDTEILPEVH